MAKALKYHYEFYDDINEVLKRVEIWVEGFVGDSTELKAGSTPLRRTYNKDVGEKYLGGVVQTSINIEAGSTSTFQAVEISSPNYGDVIIKHKIGSTVLFNAIVVPFEGSDIDLPSTYYNVSLGAECGLNKLASITYTHSGTRKKIIQVIKECLAELPYIDTFPIKVIDSTQVYGTEVLVGTDYWDTYIDDLNFKDDSCLIVIKKLIQVYNEIVFSDGAWYIRNIKEISTQDSDIHTFAWSDLAKTTASYDRPVTTAIRRAGGSFGKLFSQQNIKITKGQSKLRNTFTEGDDLTGTGWTYSGGASLVFDFEDGKLGNSRATIYTPTFVGADNTYVESPLTTFYPFQEFFSTKEKERLVIKGLATKGNYIKHLRFQIRASSGGINHYLTTEGTWYTEVSGLPTPIYEKTYTGDQEFNIDIPQPPYVTAGMLSSADRINIGEFGYFNGTDFTLPATNLAYNIYIRVYLPERTWDDPSMTGDEDYAKQLEVFIEYLRIEKADISGIVQNGFSRNYGVEETKDRKIDFSVELGVGYPSYPSGLDCLFLASSGESQGLSYGELNSLTSFEIDEFIAESYLNVLANQLKFYQGTVEADLEFTDIVEIDEIKYRIHNLEHDSRRNTSVVKLVELNSVDNVVNITPDITLSDDVIRNIDEQITKTLGSNLPIRYVDINFKETVLPTGERVIGLRDDFRKTSIYTEDAFLKASSNGLTKVITADTEDDFTWTVPAEEANRTFASREYLTDTAWLLNGNALTASKSIGSTTNVNWNLIHNSNTIATVTATGFGIGDSNPSTPLFVRKGAVGSNVAMILNEGYYGFRFMPQAGGSGTNNLFYVAGGESLAFGTDNVEKMRITSSGNVGIGTTSPSELLHVNGTSRTTNLKITNGATVGYVWQCNNADGTGAWTTPLTSERYIGEWAANSGSAPSGSPTTGDYWVVNTAGTYSGTTYAAGDEIYWNGSAWLKRSNYLTLPTATSSILGGIKIGSNLAIDGSGVVTVTSSPILTTARAIALSGDATWSVSFNGSANVTSGLTLATVNSNVGTFRSVTVNAKGLVTAATNPAIVLTTDVSGILPIANGGTGSSTQNFVDFTTADQEVTARKYFYAGIKFRDVQSVLASISRGTYSRSGGLTQALTSSAVNIGLSASGFTAISNGDNIKALYGDAGLLLGDSLDYTVFASERLQVNGNIRYNTLLKPNNIAGTNGQFLGTTGTQDVWTTITTSHISNLSSYTGFDSRYFTETEANGRFVDFDTDQNINGIKSFAQQINIGSSFFGEGIYSISGTSRTFTKISSGNGLVLNYGTRGTHFAQDEVVYMSAKDTGLLIGTALNKNTFASEKLQVNGNIRYNTLLKPNNVAGTNGQVLGTNGTQDSWVTLSTPYISDLNSYDDFLYYYTKTDSDARFAPISHTLDSHSNVTITSNSSGEILKWNGTAWINNTLAEAGIQPTLPSGTAGQFLIRNASAELEFFNLELEPTRLTSNKIAVGDSANYLSDYNNFEFLESRFVSILKVDDSTKSVAWGMYGASSNSFISASGGSLTVRGDNGLIFSNFAGGGTLALTVDNDGKVGVTPLGTGVGSTPTLASTYIGYGSSGNALTGTSNFTYDAIKTAMYFNDGGNYLYVGKSVSVSDMYEITAVGTRGIQLNTDTDIVIKNSGNLYLGAGGDNERVHIGRGASYNDANHYLVINGETFSFSMDNISGWGDTNSETTPQVGDKVLFNVVDVGGNKRFVPQKINKKLASALSGSETVLIL